MLFFNFSVKNALSLIIIVCMVISMGYLYPTTIGAGVGVTVSNVGTVISAYSDSSGGFYILCDKNGCYSAVHINSDGSYSVQSTSISTNTQGYTYCNGYFYFLTYKTPTADDNYTSYAYVTSLRCSDGYISQTVLNGVDVSDTTYLAVDADGSYYFRNSTTIRIYSAKKVLVNKIVTRTMLYSIHSSQNGDFVVCGFSDCIGVISNNELVTYSASGKFAAICGGNIVTTDDGSVYSVTATSASYITSFSDASIGAAVVGSYTVGYDNGCLAAKYGSDTVSTISCDAPLIITSSNNICLCLYQNGTGIKATLYSESDFAPAEESGNASSGSTASAAEKTTSSGSAATVSSGSDNIGNIKSDSYTLSSSEGTIRGIEPSTTIATIKSNIEYGSCSVSFTNHNGKAVTSGSVGTGATITFSGGGESITYTIIIRGDITGEGNIKSNDKSSLKKYLLGSDSLTNTELLAADVTGDGTVDIKDLLAVAKYIDGTYDISQ